MAGLRNNKNTQNAQWADYVGDILRGSQLNRHGFNRHLRVI